MGSVECTGRRQRTAADACASREPDTVTSVPPSTGPDHGAIDRTTMHTTSSCTPDDVYSRPFVLTSTDASPDDDAVALHASATSPAYAARTTVALNRQRSAPDASADAENPTPTTVTGVPPSDAPRAGHRTVRERHAARRELLPVR